MYILKLSTKSKSVKLCGIFNQSYKCKSIVFKSIPDYKQRSHSKIKNPTLYVGLTNKIHLLYENTRKTPKEFTEWSWSKPGSCHRCKCRTSHNPCV